jgi:hypothetical protein
VSKVNSKVDDLAWRKSSFSGMNGCIEVAPMGAGKLAWRDSKNPGEGFFVYDAHEWRSFLKGIRAGEFDDLV